MSAKNRGSILINQEFYPTPEYSTKAILKEINFDKVNTFLEPCKGLGHIYDLIPVTNKSYCELSEGKDYLKTKVDKADLILTNPPFSLAQEFIKKSLQESNTVIMLQRINFLGSKGRKQFWNSNPPTHLFVLSERPKFIAKCTKCKNPNNYQIGSIEICPLCGGTVKPQSDATEYAWFVWDKSGVMFKDKGIYVI
jgi:hypothetical protein